MPSPGSGGLDWARRIELISILLAALAAVVGLWYSNNQVREELAISRENLLAAQEGQITDRYTAAITNLGDDSLDVRLGGIYALQRIMTDSPRDQPTIANVLAAYIRTHTGGEGVDGPLPADALAAISVLAARDPALDAPGLVIDLRGARLRGADLSSLYQAATEPPEPPEPIHDIPLPGLDDIVYLVNSPNLRLTDLRDADLSDTVLRNADFRGANLVGAELAGADLNLTRFGDADLTGADLTEADLTEADFTRADLTGANLTGADLTETDLSGAKVSADQILAAEVLDFSTRLPEDLADDPAIRARIAEPETGRAGIP